jgi:hypothetical protein
VQAKTSRPRRPGQDVQAKTSRPRRPGQDVQAKSSRPKAPGQKLQAKSSRPRAPGQKLQAKSSGPKAPGQQSRPPDGGPPLHARATNNAKKQFISGWPLTPRPHRRLPKSSARAIGAREIDGTPTLAYPRPRPKKSVGKEAKKHCPACPRWHSRAHCRPVGASALQRPRSGGSISSPPGRSAFRPHPAALGEGGSDARYSRGADCPRSFALARPTREHRALTR